MVDLGIMIAGVVHDCIKNAFTIVNGGRKHSLIPLQNEELRRRNLSIDNRVELKDSESIRG